MLITTQNDYSFTKHDSNLKTVIISITFRCVAAWSTDVLIVGTPVAVGLSKACGHRNKWFEGSASKQFDGSVNSWQPVLSGTSDVSDRQFILYHAECLNCRVIPKNSAKSKRLLYNAVYIRRQSSYYKHIMF